ncbi:sulphate transporter [Denitrovibrio acetiphilus DSM 12809]|uniref:Sulphate transporter n=1 Tax=Denitrovibrio acetiphilus (strain DSM 12809 / NBRC 114555 / N2460) TaxID=522772 RepID=D4H3L6_DENA2|nr:SulP family inorganic anion transporter [Denitrovibrio acetiphilus]ADD69118.1 sulphate transporter [Denitrovibrio acetiphilus DSM 12809]
MPHNISKSARLTGDIYGGLTAAVIALPLALAFGVASGAGAEAGLYGAIILGFVASAFGGTPVQISGPTGPMTVVVASAIALFAGDFHSVVTVIFLGGIFQIALGFLKVGKLVRFIPYPVISGFMTGIGVIIILLQLHPLAGASGYSSPIMAIKHIGTLFTNFHNADLALGALTLIIVFFFPKKLSSKIPSPLAALIVCTVLSVAMGLDVHTIGHIPTALPKLHMPFLDMSNITFVVGTALSLAVLGSIDSLLTSLVSDSLTKTNHQPNRELMAQGLGNSLAALFGGIPGAGATMRTVVNVKAGGSTRFSGMLHAVVLALILLVFGSKAELIPMAVLSGILIKVGFDIVDYRFLKILKKAPKHDIIVMFAVLALTVLVDLIVAVGVGIVLASILLTYRIAQQTNSQIHEIPVTLHDSELGREIQESTKFSVRVIDINGPFFFGSTSQIVGRIGSFLGTEIVIFNCINVPFIDYSAVFALSEKILKLKSFNTKPMLVFNKDIAKQLEKYGIPELLPDKKIFNNLDEAIKHIRQTQTFAS